MSTMSATSPSGAASLNTLPAGLLRSSTPTMSDARRRALAIIGLVFVSPEGTPFKPESISQSFERAVKRSGLPRIRLHDLRHTHATHLLASGANAKLASDRLGHSSVAFTLDTYGHVLPGQQADAADAVARLVDFL